MIIIERLLESFLPPGLIRDGLIGDLTELRARRKARTGSTRAELWYVKELLWAVMRYAPTRARSVFVRRRTPAEPTRLTARLVRGGIAMLKHENSQILSSVRRGGGLALLWAGLAALVYVPTATAGVTTSAVAVLGFLSFAGGLSLFAKAVKQEILDELRASVGDRP